jgi:hypothetical protein
LRLGGYDHNLGRRDFGFGKEENLTLFPKRRNHSTEIIVILSHATSPFIQFICSGGDWHIVSEIIPEPKCQPQIFLLVF